MTRPIWVVLRRPRRTQLPSFRRVVTVKSPHPLDCRRNYLTASQRRGGSGPPEWCTSLIPRFGRCRSDREGPSNAWWSHAAEELEGAHDPVAPLGGVRDEGADRRRCDACASPLPKGSALPPVDRRVLPYVPCGHLDVAWVAVLPELFRRSGVLEQ